MSSIKWKEFFNRIQMKISCHLSADMQKRKQETFWGWTDSQAFSFNPSICCQICDNLAQMLFKSSSLSIPALKLSSFALK